MIGDMVEVLDLSYEGDTLVAQSESVAITTEPEDRLILSWNAGSHAAGYASLGDGVVLIRSRRGVPLHIDGPRRAVPDVLGPNQYLWRDTNHHGVMHLVLILPAGKVIKTVVDCSPPPMSFKVYNSRMAFYWELQADQTEVAWKLVGTGRVDVKALCGRLNDRSQREGESGTQAGHA